MCIGEFADIFLVQLIHLRPFQIIFFYNDVSFDKKKFESHMKTLPYSPPNEKFSESKLGRYHGGTNYSFCPFHSMEERFWLRLAMSCLSSAIVFCFFLFFPSATTCLFFTGITHTGISPFLVASMEKLLSFIAFSRMYASPYTTSYI